MDSLYDVSYLVHVFPELMEKDKIFTDQFLDEIGFKRVEHKGTCGAAHDIRTNGMTRLQWNTHGHHCTYFGENLPPNISFGILKDGGTRTAFNGYIYSQDDIRMLLNRTW